MKLLGIEFIPTKIKDFLWLDKFRKYLRSGNFGTLTLLGLTSVLAYHNYFLFRVMVAQTGATEMQIYYTSIFYSVFVSASILFYTLRGKELVAYWFMIFEIIMNLYYLVIMVTLNDLNNTPWYGGIPWHTLIINIPIALVIPIAVKRYATEMKEAELEQYTHDHLTDYYKKNIRKEVRDEFYQEIKKEFKAREQRLGEKEQELKTDLKKVNEIALSKEKEISNIKKDLEEEFEERKKELENEYSGKITEMELELRGEAKKS